MSILIELPLEMEAHLTAEWQDLERHALEGFAVEAFRSGKLSSSNVARLLGLANRWAAIEFLSARGAYPSYELDDLEEDRHATNDYYETSRRKANA